MMQFRFLAHRNSLTAFTLAKVSYHPAILLLLLISCLLPCSAWATAGIIINAPGASAQIVSPVPFSATATSNGLPITAMKVYLDGNPSEVGNYTGNGTSSFSANATYAMAVGSHNLTVNAWDTSDNLYQSVVSFTVSTTGVVIAQPTQNESVASPVSFDATATSNGLNITAMNVYLDFNPTAIGAYNGNGTSSLHETASYTITGGPHTIIANAWDTNGQIYQSAVNFTVGTAGGAIPPANATLTPNIDNMTNWGSCSSQSCSGAGGGSAASLQATYGVSSPKLESGGSIEFLAQGTAGADILHWNNLPSNVNFNKFVFDYYFQVDNVAPIQTLEFDFQPGSPTQQFNFSFQCNNGNPSNPVWDTWDQPTVSWTSTGISCATVMNANNWHHIRMYGEILNRGLSSAQTHYIWVEVDGMQHPITTNATHNAVSKSWDKLGVTAQQDINSTGGIYHVFVDKMNLYVW